MVGGKSAPKNIWRYDVKFKEKTPDEALMELLDLCVNRKETLLSLKQQYELSIKLFIRSDFGQLGYTLPASVIKSLAQLEVDLETHILSFGGVE